MNSVLIPSPLGDLIAVASETHLLVLAFADSKGLEKNVGVIAMKEAIQKTDTKSPLPPFIKGEENKILTQTKKELSEYFDGKRNTFTIPLAPEGTEFQQKAWEALTMIPYGETRSYKEEAVLAEHPRAVRAIGGANNKNPIVVIIPCHRVVGVDGSLTGYAGGLERKKWLLEHEKRYSR